MKVGEYRLIHNNPWHLEKDEVREIEITEVRSVSISWSKSKGDGFRAVDAQGRTYENGWNGLDGTAMRPHSWWRCVDEEEGANWSAVEEARVDLKLCPKFVSKYPRSIKYCRKHRNLYHPDDYFGCFSCHIGDPAHHLKSIKWRGSPWKGAV